MKKLVEERIELIASKRTEELKVLVDGWAKKAQQQGFTTREVLDEFSKYLPQKASRGAAIKNAGSADAGGDLQTSGDGKTWTKADSGSGRTITWLQELVEGGGREKGLLG